MIVKVFFLTLCVFLLYCQAANAQNDWVSPCPRLFVYEGRSKEPNRWYGIVTLLSDTDLNGVWMRIGLDKPARSIGNWFGQVVTNDLKEYLIKNRDYQLKASEPQTVRFFVEFDPNQSPPPKLEFIRLNAKTICPEQSATEDPAGGGVLQTSSYREPDRSFSSPKTPIVSVVRPTPPSIPVNRNTDSNDICGIVITQPRPLITAGQDTVEGEFPWHAALYHTKGLAQMYICGGSLVSKQHVITAAHCVTKSRSNKPVDPSSLFVFLGKFHLKRFTNVGIQDREVTEVITHPEYSGQTFKNDIAIVKLGGEVDITDYVRPICLWQDPPDINTVIDKQGSVVGWGFDETGTLSEELTQAKMPVVSEVTCIRSYPEFYSRFTSDHTYCAGFRNGTSVCNGDSGGGMVFPKADSKSLNPVWQLRGIVSISVAFQSRACDTSNYVVFTDAAKYLDWIGKSIK